MLKAIEYIGDIGIGYTNPQIFKCSDGHYYVVKFLDLVNRKRSLPNEYLAYMLGQYINLPMPTCESVYVSQDLIQSSEHLQSLKVESGLHFGSRLIKKTKSVKDKNISKCLNIDKLADMFVFDIWVDNRDRKPKNLLIAKDQGELNLFYIDHDYILGSKNWTLEDLNNLHEEIQPKWGYSQKRLIKYIHNPDLLRHSYQLIQSINTCQIVKAVAAIPSEWYVSEDERKVLVDLLVNRKDNLLAPAIENLIENKFKLE